MNTHSQAHSTKDHLSHSAQLSSQNCGFESLMPSLRRDSSNVSILHFFSGCQKVCKLSCSRQETASLYKLASLNFFHIYFSLFSPYGGDLQCKAPREMVFSLTSRLFLLCRLHLNWGGNSMIGEASRHKLMRVHRGLYNTIWANWENLWGYTTFHVVISRNYLGRIRSAGVSKCDWRAQRQHPSWGCTWWHIWLLLFTAVSLMKIPTCIWCRGSVISWLCYLGWLKITI